jgi:hypothetical protein
MRRGKIIFLLACAFLSGAPDAGAFSVYSHPEIAEENSLFLNLRLAGVSFAGGFDFLVLDVSADWLLPFPPPLSLGFFVTAPSFSEPNLKHFGPRLAWHIDADNEKIDLYFFYSLDLGWLRNEKLEEAGDSPVEKRFYDFRAGVRFFFRKNIGMFAESGYKFMSVNFGLSIKLN